MCNIYWVSTVTTVKRTTRQCYAIRNIGCRVEVCEGDANTPVRSTTRTNKPLSLRCLQFITPISSRFSSASTCLLCIPLVSLIEPVVCNLFSYFLKCCVWKSASGKRINSATNRFCNERVRETKHCTIIPIALRLTPSSQRQPSADRHG